MAAAMGGLVANAYILPTVAVVEILAGVSFLTNKFVPLAALILAPISFSIVATHLLFDPAGTAPALIVLIANVLLFVKYKERFMPIISK
jgi:hypothetical protein